ncbi:MAG: SIS domain-containing protein [Alphaproteobacteria bacterium]|nr:SIS domain-containing protein [Alphaproteobacteria bacterium]
MAEKIDVASYIATSAGIIAGLSTMQSEILKAADLWTEALSRGGKILFCGNGGSAADAEHLAAELMGRFLIERDPMPALALTVNSSAATAIANDYGYHHIFARQLRAFAKTGDVLVGLSTSGNSRNVLDAFVAARTMGVATVALTGAGGGQLAPLSDVLLAVNDARTCHIQEGHIVLGHLICAIVEQRLCSPRP